MTNQLELDFKLDYLTELLTDVPPLTPPPERRPINTYGQVKTMHSENINY
ncbi:MAG TPA: hypothetical protein VL020_07870 [Pseudomonadales bacterium]|nr:hypothetical protein [Pseudomonadales bacterium]